MKQKKRKSSGFPPKYESGRLTAESNPQHERRRMLQIKAAIVSAALVRTPACAPPLPHSERDGLFHTHIYSRSFVIDWAGAGRYPPHGVSPSATPRGREWYFVIRL